MHPLVHAIVEVIRSWGFTIPMTLLITGAGFSVRRGFPLTSELLYRIHHYVSTVPAKDKVNTTLALFEPFLEILRERAQGTDFEVIMTTARTQSLQGKADWLAELGIPEEVLPDYIRKTPEFAYDMLLYGMACALHGRGFPDPLQGFNQYYEFYTKNEIHCVITTNYDDLWERIFWFADQGLGNIDYGFRPGALLAATETTRHPVSDRYGVYVPRVSARPQHPAAPRMQLLKIHGSSNMTYCPGCDHPIVFDYAVPAPDYLSEPVEIIPGRPHVMTFDGTQFAWFETCGYHSAFHCGDPGDQPPYQSETRLKPLCVPPVQNKETLPEWSLLAAVQEQAMQAADTSSRAIIVGSAIREHDQQLLELIELLRGEVEFIGDDAAFARLKQRCPQAIHVAACF